MACCHRFEFECICKSFVIKGISFWCPKFSLVPGTNLIRELEYLKDDSNANRPQSKENLKVCISQSIERKKQPIAKQLMMAAALCISLVLGASFAKAQAATTTTPTHVTI